MKRRLQGGHIRGQGVRYVRQVDGIAERTIEAGKICTAKRSHLGDPVGIRVGAAIPELGHGAIDRDGVGAGRGIHVVPIGSTSIGVGTAISPVHGGVHRALYWQRYRLAGAGGHHFEGEGAVVVGNHTGIGASEVGVILECGYRGCAAIGTALHGRSQDELTAGGVHPVQVHLGRIVTDGHSV